MWHRAIYPVIAVSQKSSSIKAMILTNVSPANFNTMCATLTARNRMEVTKKQSAGLTTGQITDHGTRIDYSYDAKAQTLTAEVIHHPFWTRAVTAENGLRDAMLPAESTPKSATAGKSGTEGTAA
jgi:hypothetical protein